MKKKFLIAASVAVVLIGVVVYFTSNNSDTQSVIEVQVERGEFKVIVTTSGELQAENSERILGPSSLRNIRVFQVKITDLIAEGTVVDSGAYVATLDRSEVTNKLKDIELGVEQSETALKNAKLDTTLELRNLRDQLINLKYAVEEMEITVEQSKFEPPAAQRQSKINLEKSERAYRQAIENYDLKIEQAKAKIQGIVIELTQEQSKRDDIVNVLDDFVINAPKPGMVIYAKEWGGSKRKVGSNISPWDLTVATLPDLSSMVSKTYVNEIDISKVKKEQKVIVGVDAFPEKKFKGEVIEIANIGQQMPNGDAKVFEVVIKLIESDSILRPSMTTSNIIETQIFEDVVFVPIEAVHNKDSMNFVYKSEGFDIVRQEVVLGETNDNHVIINQGLTENDLLRLDLPDNADGLRVVRLKKKQSEIEKETNKLTESNLSK